MKEAGGYSKQRLKELVGPKFHHISLRVRSLQVSIEFYNHLFGYHEVLRHNSPPENIVHLSQDGMAVLEIIKDEHPNDLESHGNVHLGFYCPDIPTFMAQLTRLGWQIERGPFSVGQETILFIRDPDGYLIEINNSLGGLGTSPLEI